MEEVFDETMPPGMGYDYMGMSYQEQKAQQGISPMVIFGFSLLFVFLILAAQYESWTLPFSVLLGTPVAVFGAFAAMMVGRYENNVYAQIGLVMLIGLSAKNAILIVEFAKMGYEEGKPLMDAALEGARAAAASDSDDQLCLHPRLRAAGHGHRCWSRVAPRHGLHRHRRHVGGELHRHFPDPGYFLHHRKTGRRKTSGSQAG